MYNLSFFSSQQFYQQQIQIFVRRALWDTQKKKNDRHCKTIGSTLTTTHTNGHVHMQERNLKLPDLSVTCRCTEVVRSNQQDRTRGRSLGENRGGWRERREEDRENSNKNQNAALIFRTKNVRKNEMPSRETTN